MYNKRKHKNKKQICRYCLQCHSRKKVLLTHKEVCLKKNDKQSIKLSNGPIKANNFSKQLAIPFKIYANFQSVLRGVQRDDKGSNAFYTKK